MKFSPRSCEIRELWLIQSCTVFFRRVCVGEALGGLKQKRLELPLAHIWCGLAFLF